MIVPTDVTVASVGIFTHEANGNWPSPGEQHKLNLSIAGDLTVASNGAIYVSSKGYGGGPGYLAGTVGHGGEGGLWEVTVQATVSLAELRKDLQAIKILIEEKENPRIAVIFREHVDGGELPAPVLQTAFEKFFVEAYRSFGGTISPARGQKGVWSITHVAADLRKLPDSLERRFGRVD